MDKNYGGIIWTNHAIERLCERGISQNDAYYTFQHPDQSRYASTQQAYVYYKTYGKERIEVVAKQNEKKQWIILSVWKKPIFDDKSYKKIKERKGPIWLQILRDFFKI